MGLTKTLSRCDLLNIYFVPILVIEYYAYYCTCITLVSVTQQLRMYHNQIIGVTNRNTMVLRLQNVKFFMTPTLGHTD